MLRPGLSCERAGHFHQSNLVALVLCERDGRMATAVLMRCVVPHAPQSGSDIAHREAIAAGCLAVEGNRADADARATTIRRQHRVRRAILAVFEFMTANATTYRQRVGLHRNNRCAAPGPILARVKAFAA